jgi:hypothetical protein
MHMTNHTTKEEKLGKFWPMARGLTAPRGRSDQVQQNFAEKEYTMQHKKITQAQIILR